VPGYRICLEGKKGPSSVRFIRDFVSNCPLLCGFPSISWTYFVFTFLSESTSFPRRLEEVVANFSHCSLPPPSPNTNLPKPVGKVRRIC
jgi:hypothetical protein